MPRLPHARHPGHSYLFLAGHLTAPVATRVVRGCRVWTHTHSLGLGGEVEGGGRRGGQRGQCLQTSFNSGPRRGDNDPVAQWHLSS